MDTDSPSSNRMPVFQDDTIALHQNNSQYRGVIA